MIERIGGAIFPAKRDKSQQDEMSVVTVFNENLCNFISSVEHVWVPLPSMPFSLPPPLQALKSMFFPLAFLTLLQSL